MTPLNADLDRFTCGHSPINEPTVAGTWPGRFATLALGGVAHELRRRPHPTEPNDETRGSMRTPQIRINKAGGKGGDR